MSWLVLLWQPALAGPPPNRDTGSEDTAWYNDTSEATGDTGSITPPETGDTGQGGSGGSGGSGGDADTDTDTDSDTDTDVDTDIDTGEDKQGSSCGCEVPGLPAGAALGIGWAAALIARRREGNREKKP
jgi:hypothetical protein